MAPRSVVGSLVLVIWATQNCAAQVPQTPTVRAVQDPFVDGPDLPTARPAVPPDRRGYVGFVADDDSQGGGVRVTRVIAGGPAAKAGLMTGDVIVAINGAKVQSMDDIAARLLDVAVGSTAKIDVTRDGEPLSIKALVSRRPSTPIATPDSTPQLKLGAPPADPVSTSRPAPLGIRVVPVNSSAQPNLNLPVARGAQVVRVTPGSAAERAGIKVDDVLVAIDGREITGPDDAAKILGQAQAGQTMRFALYQAGELVERNVTPQPAAGAALAPAASSPFAPATVSAQQQPVAVLPEPPSASSEAVVEGTDSRVREMAARIDDLEKRLATLEQALRKFMGENPADPFAPDKTAPAKPLP